MMTIRGPEFDLALTLNSGQVFHWQSAGDGFIGTIGERALLVQQRGRELTVDEGEEPGFCARSKSDLRKLIRDYFALDHPLAKICASFPDDPVMQEARRYCRGLRIIRQPRWECLATFITSSMKQVAHIRQMSHALRKRFGKSIPVNGTTVYSFPTASEVASLKERDLRACGLGYRAPNLLRSAQHVSSGEVDLERLALLPNDVLRAQLCRLPGVGAKVANCVMLFAYERLEAFPIDVWIERVLRNKYFPRRRKITTMQLRDFAAKHFGTHGGYAQQYLFHHARMTTRRRLSREAR